MSTDTVVGGRRVDILTRASQLARAEVAAGCGLLEVAAEWVVANPGDGLQAQQTRLEFATERAMVLAGDGTPAVAETAPATLGLEIGLNSWQSCQLIADVLDLRYRLPQIWSVVQAGAVRARHARLVASRTRLLTVEQAAEVDAELVMLISTASYGGLKNAIDAALLRADPEGARKRAEEARRWRGVRLGRETEDGAIDVHARVDAPDGIAFAEVVKRFGRLLRDNRDRLPDCVPDRDPQSVAEWEALAFGLLKTPFVTCRVLLELGCPDLFEAAVDLFSDADADWTPGPSSTHPPSDARDSHGPPDPGPSDVDHPVADLPDGDQNPSTDGDLPDGPVDVDLVVPGAADSDLTGADQTGCADQHAPHADALDREVARDRALRALIRGINPGRLLPPSVLYVHIAESAVHGDSGVARVEGIGAQLGETVRRWLGTGTRLHVVPVIDSESVSAVDRYEVPAWMKEALLARNPRSVFPFSSRVSRLMEFDHTIAYLPPPCGPPGQTGPHNLGPLANGEHRVKTFGAVRVRQVEPGTFVWHTETGRVIVTNPAGTHDLGTGAWAQQIWRAATTQHGVAGQVDPPQMR